MSPLAILMALRVKGRATAEAVAVATGCAVTAARAALADARRTGAVVVVPVPARDVEGFALSGAGHAALRAGLDGEPLDRDALASSYEKFLETDGRVKAAIAGWQQRPVRLDEVRAVASAAHAVAARLATLVGRHAPYVVRLATARAALENGDTRFVASPHVDSLHQVWFELHQDLLLTLGRERAA